ncbi:phosphoribosyl-AMP cyclohydrolase [Deltaproteobacteria bacterium TL4]
MKLNLAFDKQEGLLPVIVQDEQSNEVLMLAYVDREALEQTQKTGKAHFYSRSKKRLWMKGESSGHIQEVQEILVDCDQDTLIYKVRQIGGAACHTGYRSCFHSRLSSENTLELNHCEKVFNPQDVYST